VGCLTADLVRLASATIHTCTLFLLKHYIPFTCLEPLRCSSRIFHRIIDSTDPGIHDGSFNGAIAGRKGCSVDFGCQLLSHSRELYRSPRGSLAADDEIHLVMADLRALILKLSNTPDHGSQNASQDFRKIYDEAVMLAEEIPTRIDGLKVTAKHQAWKSFQQAIRSAWSKRETEGLITRLSRLRQALETGILSSLRYIPRYSIQACF
jgi:hypothetical protein